MLGFHTSFQACPTIYILAHGKSIFAFLQSTPRAARPVALFNERPVLVLIGENSYIAGRRSAWSKRPEVNCPTVARFEQAGSRAGHGFYRRNSIINIFLNDLTDDQIEFTRAPPGGSARLSGGGRCQHHLSHRGATRERDFRAQEWDLGQGGRGRSLRVAWGPERIERKVTASPKGHPVGGPVPGDLPEFRSQHSTSLQTGGAGGPGADPPSSGPDSVV